MSNNGLVWSPEEFTQAMAQTIALEPEIEVVGMDDLTLHLRVRGRPISSDLDSFYRIYRESPDQIAAVQQALVEALTGLPADRREDDPAVLLGRVMPMLKPAALIDEVRAQQLPPLAFRTLVGELVVTYVVDEGEQVVFINGDHLARWRVDEPLLHRRALANLRARPWQPYPGQLGAGRSGLLILNGRDGYDATRVLLPELFAEFAATTPGNVVIGVPNRDFLIAFSDAEPRVFEQVRAQIERDASTQPHPLTTQLLTLRGGRLLVYAGRDA